MALRWYSASFLVWLHLWTWHSIAQHGMAWNSKEQSRAARRETYIYSTSKQVERGTQTQEHMQGHGPPWYGLCLCMSVCDRCTHSKSTHTHSRRLHSTPPRINLSSPTDCVRLAASYWTSVFVCDHRRSVVRSYACVVQLMTSATYANIKKLIHTSNLMKWLKGAKCQVEVRCVVWPVWLFV